MKQMTKEELIEYFIEKLGYNQILGKYISIDDIRNKLTSQIQNVTYNSEQGNGIAYWNHVENRVNIDPKRISTYNQDIVIIHELLHILSNSEFAVKAGRFIHKSLFKVNKCGVCYEHYLEEGKNSSTHQTINRGINEGITEYLAEQITGTKGYTYNQEQDIFKILSFIIGEDTILEKYFSDVEPYDLMSHRQLFKDDLIKKFGEHYGQKLNDDTVKIASLLDPLTVINYMENLDNINENDIKLLPKIEDEICETLYYMINDFFLCTTHETDGEIERITKIKESLRNIHYLPGLKKIVSNNLWKAVIEDDKSLDDIQTLERYLNLFKDDNIGYKESEADKIYEIYKRTGKIDEEILKKNEIFKFIFWNTKIPETSKDIDKELQRYKYCKCGNYYSVTWLETHNDKSAQKLFNENGKEMIDAGFDKDIENVREQLKDKFEQYTIQFQKNREYSWSGTQILKCPDTGEIILVATYQEKREDIHEIFALDYTFEMFKLDSSGNLEIIPQSSEWRNITDDMSELDIQLQEQTTDVSITEIMQEADSLQVALGDKTPKTNENSRGEGNNGK